METNKHGCSERTIASSYGVFLTRTNQKTNILSADFIGDLM